MSGLIAAGVEAPKGDVFSGVSWRAGVKLESAALDGGAAPGSTCVTEDPTENAPELTAGTPSGVVAAGAGTLAVEFVAFAAVVCVPGDGFCSSSALAVCVTEVELFAA